MLSPVLCNYAPPGEYIKDHTLIFHDGFWHLYSISGTKGYSHLYNGNEETISWSMSSDLVNWDYRGHVFHASLRDGEFDQHEVWAPFCVQANDAFYFYYAGIVHPERPMCYEKMGTFHPDVRWDGHKETIGLATSENLTKWTKISDREKGISVPGRDPHVVFDEKNNRYLLYSTGRANKGKCEVLVSQSKNLIDWEYLGICAVLPDDQPAPMMATNESMTVLKHPQNDKWILLGNVHWVLSDDPVNFMNSPVHEYFEDEVDGREQMSRMGFAAEIIEWKGKWYRSGVMGMIDNWTLGFHEIEWEQDGAFHIVKESIQSRTSWD